MNKFEQFPQGEENGNPVGKQTEKFLSEEKQEINIDASQEKLNDDEYLNLSKETGEFYFSYINSLAGMGETKNTILDKDQLSF